MKNRPGVIMLAFAALFSIQCSHAPEPSAGHHSAHATPQSTSQVPAYLEAGPNLAQLGPTLPPDEFYGKTRAAYKAVREIPRTIAQLPCYCHCDRGFGHKSLHSCFEDDHAAHCAVCVDEALMAYHLEKDDQLSPEQIRARIIAEFSGK